MFTFLVFDFTFAHLLLRSVGLEAQWKKNLIFLRQRSRESKGIVFTTTLIARSKFYPHPGHVVASVDKAFYDDYVCTVASNKQQIQWAIIRKNSPEHWKLLSRCGFVQVRNTVTAIKSVRIVQ